MSLDGTTVGWIGAGRMGVELVRRLLRAGCDVSVWNRTREKAEPLLAEGARLVDTPADLGDRDLVVTCVSSSDVFEHVTMGRDGLLTRSGTTPTVLIDSSTISSDASQRVREEAGKVGTDLLAAPVSGNPKAVRAGQLTVVASGPPTAFDRAEPLLKLFGRAVTYVGDGERARLVKICHNLFLGAITQSLAEITILAERAGVSRADFLAFVNNSVLGSVFSQYKTPAFVNLDFTPTFTGHLLRKDFELGLEASRSFDVPLPLSALVHQLVMQMIGSGRGDKDFAALLELQADLSGMELRAEDREVTDGLTPIDQDAAEPS